MQVLVLKISVGFLYRRQKPWLIVATHPVSFGLNLHSVDDASVITESSESRYIETVRKQNLCGMYYTPDAVFDDNNVPTDLL